MRRAILIGSDRYEAPDLDDLDCARADVEQFEPVLLDPEIGGFNEVERLDGSGDPLRAITDLARSARSDDLLLVYFSGHGVLGGPERLYLALQQTDLEYLDGTAMPIDRIIEVLGESRCENVVLILDCCYSGAARNSFSLPKHWSGRGFVIISSSTSVQESGAKKGESASLFTRFLLDGLITGDADVDSNGTITVKDAYLYAYHSLSSSDIQDQTPLELGVRAGSMTLASNRFYSGPVVTSIEPASLLAYQAVGTMIELVDLDESRRFMVGVKEKYFIEGEVYGMSGGITVGQDYTLNMRRSASGFEADVFYPPSHLSEHAQRDKEVLNGVMKVRLVIPWSSIRFVAGTIEGESVNLYA